MEGIISSFAIFIGAESQKSRKTVNSENIFTYTSCRESGEQIVTFPACRDTDPVHWTGFVFLGLRFSKKTARDDAA